MNHGTHTWASIPSGEHGDTATINGVALTCVLLRTGPLWLPTDLSHHTTVVDGQ